MKWDNPYSFKTRAERDSSNARSGTLGNVPILLENINIP
jgi:hypothetical protein